MCFAAAKKIREEHEKEYKQLTDAKYASEGATPLETEHHISDNNDIALISSDFSTYGACDNKAFEGDDKYILNETHDTKLTVNQQEGDRDSNQTMHDHHSSEEDKPDRSVNRQTETIGLKYFLPTLILLLRSPTFVFLCLAYACSFMVITSYAVFMAKTVQFQYNQTAPMAAIMAGKWCGL